MAAGGYDGSININTKIDESGFNKGVKNIGSGLDGLKSSLKSVATAVGIAFGVAAVVNFGKQSVEAATNLTNALTGLQSVLQGQGRNFQSANTFIQSYISDGLIPATNAVAAYKNLALRGYDDTQIQNTLKALKDSAAFARQGSLTMGEAVQSATEGLKNELSVLVDNAGVTKNVSQMWSDYAKSIGVGVNDLTKAQKIQAEYNGIMQETRFQTGDAAKLAGNYSGEVQQLGFNFNNLKIAAGNALIPMAQAVLPGLNSIITALTRVVNLAAQVTAALFGKQAAQASQNKAIASTASSAAAAQNELADSTKKAANAASDSTASWDQLNVLQQDTGSAAADTGAASPTAAAADATAGQQLGAGVTVSPDIQKAADTIRGIFADIDKALGPTKVALSGLWAEFQRIGSFSWAALLDFYHSFLEPVGKWTLGVGLPGFINALKDGMAKIDWGKINTSLHGLWEALTPFAVNVGSGLLWFWQNVLVPLGTWTMNNVVPLFLDILSEAIKGMNNVIDALKPLGLWLFDNFLKPLAAWTGGVIVSVLTDIKTTLSGISDWIGKNQGLVQGMTVTVGLFFAAWKVSDLLIFITDAGGIVGAITKITNAVREGTVAKLADRIELMEVIASYAKDFVVGLVDSTKKLIENTAEWITGTAAKLSAAAAQDLMNAKTVIWTTITQIATAVTTAFGAAIQFLTSPIGLVILAIAALIAIVVLLVTHWDQVKAAAAACWAAIVAAWNVAAAWFNNTVVTPVKNFFAAMWATIKSAAQTAWSGIVSVWNVVSTWFNTNIIKPVGKFFSDLWAGISGAASSAWASISTVWQTVSFWFGDHVIKPIETAFKSSINFMIGLVEGFVNGFINGINAIIGALDRIHVDIPATKLTPEISFGIDIPRVNTISIPRLATGAVIPPRAEMLAILGDQRSGKNIEAPEGLIRSIVAEELSKIDVNPQFTLQASGEMGPLIKLMRVELRKENQRVGTIMATGGERC